MVPLYQADKRWSGIILGHGPSTIGRAGCVLVSLTVAARTLGTRPDLLPPHLNVAAVVAGAFAGDELIVPRAALACGLLADEHAVMAEPGHASLVDAVAKALATGLALLRVDINLDGGGDHTILAGAIGSGGVDCVCPAVGRVRLSPALEATVSWGKAGVKKYRVVGVRGVRRPVQ